MDREECLLWVLFAVQVRVVVGRSVVVGHIQLIGGGVVDLCASGCAKMGGVGE